MEEIFTHLTATNGNLHADVTRMQCSLTSMAQQSEPRQKPHLPSSCTPRTLNSSNILPVTVLTDG